MKVDKIIIHEVDEYYTLPEGGRFMKRNGMPDVWEYKVVEHVRAHNVEHIYKVTRVKLADGTFVNTMEHPLKNLGGIFFILSAEKQPIKLSWRKIECLQLLYLAQKGISNICIIIVELSF